MDIFILLLSNINWIDIFVLICLIRTIYMGYSRGFLAEIPRLISVIVVIVLTYHYYGRLGQFLSENQMFSPESGERLAFILLVLFFAIVLKLICMFIRLVVKIAGPHTFEVVGGLIIGVIRGLILASLLLACLQFLFPTYLETSIYEGSYLGPKVISIAPKIHEICIGFKANLSKKD